ncbi:MAG: methionine synthase [Subdoligranulum sp.]|nr:methionine synthase [Subdoligranulum sp.]MBD5101968.1 methionine synthase [Subdoligranulum sp.]
MPEIWEVALPGQPDIPQALRYLGVPDAGDAALHALLQRAEQTLRGAARPRAVSLRAGREGLAGCLQGGDIARHLEGCDTCVLLACTLGAGVDAAQRAANAADMAYAVVLDALASVLAEQIADAAENTLREQAQAEGLFLTGRFSPGYGDYPIELQNELLRLVDAPRKIGLCATPTHLLTPRKSITAVLGLAGHPVTGKRAGCAHCALRERCAYRKEGKTCE